MHITYFFSYGSVLSNCFNLPSFQIHLHPLYHSPMYSSKLSVTIAISYVAPYQMPSLNLGIYSLPNLLFFVSPRYDTQEMNHAWWIKSLCLDWANLALNSFKILEWMISCPLHSISLCEKLPFLMLWALVPRIKWPNTPKLISPSIRLIPTLRLPIHKPFLSGWWLPIFCGKKFCGSFHMIPFLVAARKKIETRSICLATI